ncbi:hypothetical protein Dimus_014533 [Dionaea muscipula]
MEEDDAIIETILREEAELNGEVVQHHGASGWKTVSYKQRRKPPAGSDPDHIRTNGDDVFRSVEHEAEERRRRVIESQRAALEAAGVDPGSGSIGLLGETIGHDSDVEDAGDGAGAGEGSGGGEVKKRKKAQKQKKPKVTVAEASQKIDGDDLAAFLSDISTLYESQEDIQLMRFADYFGRAFGSVSYSQFPWAKLLRESTVEKMIDIPLGNISEAIYKTSVDWLSHRSAAALGSFILWAWDGILAELNTHQQGNVKSSKKVEQQTSSKSQGDVISFSVSSALERLDKLSSQASERDFVVGLHMWVQLLLPMLSEKSCNPQSRDLILQLVERIVSSPKARQILLNGAARKGERLVPPQALESLMRLTFPSLSARIKATERFEAVYPTLKEVALAGSPGTPELTREACDVFIWCLTQHPDCCKQWVRTRAFMFASLLGGPWSLHALNSDSCYDCFSNELIGTG